MMLVLRKSKSNTFSVLSGVFFVAFRKMGWRTLTASWRGLRTAVAHAPWARLP